MPPGRRGGGGVGGGSDNVGLVAVGRLEPPSRVSSAKAEAKQASADGRAGLLAEAARLDASWSEKNSMLAGCAKEQEPRVNALLRRGPRRLRSAWKKSRETRQLALQKKRVNIRADYAERVDKWNIRLISDYPADTRNIRRQLR